MCIYYRQWHVTRMAGERSLLGKRKVCLHLDDILLSHKALKYQHTQLRLDIYHFIHQHIAASHYVQLAIIII